MTQVWKIVYSLREDLAKLDFYETLESTKPVLSRYGTFDEIRDLMDDDWVHTDAYTLTSGVPLEIEVQDGH